MFTGCSVILELIQIGSLSLSAVSCVDNQQRSIMNFFFGALLCVDQSKAITET